MVTRAGDELPGWRGALLEEVGLVRTALAVVAGAVVGFLVAVPIYLLASPVLESGPGLLRETQGLLWNLVPALTVFGGVLGWWWTRRGHA